MSDNERWSPTHWVDTLAAARKAFEAHVERVSKTGILTTADRSEADLDLMEIIARVASLAGDNERALKLLHRATTALANMKSTRPLKN